MLIENKVKLKEIDWAFLKMYASLGFKSSDELLAKAIDLLKNELDSEKKRQLEDSAKLYAEMYKEDLESHEWIDSANEDWN